MFVERLEELAVYVAFREYADRWNDVFVRAREAVAPRPAVVSG